MPNAWEDADRISDRIVDLLREELKKPGCDPVGLFAGQMLAMTAMLAAAKNVDKPATLVAVEVALGICLQDLLRNRPPPTSH